MLSALFKQKTLIDDTSRTWIFDTFVWCVEQLDGNFFHEQTRLILPNNEFYPGVVSSVEEMAEAIFSNTINYTGMTCLYTRTKTSVSVWCLMLLLERAHVGQ